MSILPLRLAAAGLAAGLLPLVAAAHPGPAETDGSLWMTGFWHPLTGADHLVALLAIGVWTALAARRGRADLWLLPLTLLAALLTGALLTHAGLALPAVEPMIAWSLLVLGLALARPEAGSRPATLAVVAGFAIFHGAAHGSALSSLASIGGMAAASAMVCAAGVAVGLAVRHRSRWLSRLAGAGVGLMGLGLLTGLLA
jgi:urease accessory protein